jgi:hypothetical protein
MFQNSQNTDARGSTFIDHIGRDQVQIGQIINTNNADPLALLYPVPDATYHSMATVSGCMKGTRLEVINKIVGWIDGDSNQPICWLHGAAGSGKSAIARTIAEWCAVNNELGASFFFLRGAGRRSSITHFISTLAHNLALADPARRPYIENALQRDHYIVHRSLDHQFRTLITEPIPLRPPPLPMVIVIDALDECDDKELVADFIEIVARATLDPQLPLRFFFTSRVEEHIQEKFSTSPALDATYCVALHEFDADADIRTFFRTRFSTIYQEKRRLIGKITLPWPSESDLDELVSKSDGSFIFAFTLVNFVNNGSDLPHRKLQAALQSHAGLDPLYSQILLTAPRSSHFVQIFETIMTVEERLSVMDLACLLQVETGDVVHALLGIQSVLVVPENDHYPIRPFHTSLRDFLNTKTRSKDLFIDPSIRHLLITSNCLATMVAHNGKDFFEDEGLRFACVNWIHHLLAAMKAEGDDNLLFSEHGTFFLDKLTDFVSWSFDSWINSIISQVQIGITLDTLDSVVSTLKESYRYLPNMVPMIEKIRAFTELDVRDLCL